MRAPRATLTAILLWKIGVALAGPAGVSERGAVLVQSFSPRTYGAHPQNWSAVQDKDGLMFFGNSDGVLEYDGVSWRILKLPEGGAVRSLGTDRLGRIAIGGQGEIGFLSPDANGALIYTSLLGKLLPDDRKFKDVWSVLQVRGDVYFSSYRRLFRWQRDGSVKVWRPKSQFGKAFVVNDTLMLVVEGHGLHKLVNDELRPVPGGEIFQKTSISGLFLWNGHFTAVTRAGLMVQNGDHFDALPTEADGIFGESRVTAAMPLSGGSLALGTLRSGLVVVDSSGHLESQIQKEHGLPADYVVSLYTDRQDSVWITTTSGLARMEPRTTIFDERHGLRGGTTAIARQGDLLYAGTQTGLYVLKAEKGKAARFEPVKDIPEAVFVLVPSSRGLLVGGQRGVYTVDGQTAKLRYKTDVIFDLHFSRNDPSLLYVAGRSGFAALNVSREVWNKQSEILGGDEEFRALIEDEDGKVWIATKNGILHADIGQTPPTTQRYDLAKGVPNGWNGWYGLRDHPVLTTEQGLRRYNRGRDNFVVDTSLGDQFVDASHPVTLIRKDHHNNLWISGKDYHGVLLSQGDRKWQWRNMPLWSSRLSEIWALHFDPKGEIWAAGPEGWITRYEATGEGLPKTLHPALAIRSVQSQSSKQILYGGGGSPKRTFEIASKASDLRFEFSAILFEFESRTRYQVILDGFDKEWSEWTGETRKDYTHLSDGKFVFRVRAQHPQAQGIHEARFSFRVLPPWYRTWWAYTLYSLLAAAAILALVGWRVRYLQDRNNKLEALVADRTVEIRRQRDQIVEEEHKTEALLLNILPKEVASELRSAGSVQPRTFEDVTVCFTDFVGFTLSGEGVSPHLVVQALHDYFSAFDEIIARYNLEKLKTIGDSYMFVGGLPQQRKAHALDSVLAALEIADTVEQMKGQRSGISWQIRIGLHSGPVVAGVVGKAKFAFDIWGDTVNLASRMESCGSPDRVNISKTVYELVRDFISCQPRGFIGTKEGRKYEMYFACKLKDEDAGGAITSDFRTLYQARFGELPPPFEVSAVENIG